MYTAQGIVQLVDVKAGDTHTHTQPSLFYAHLL